MPMLTSEVRKKALAAAVWTYERAGGNLLHTIHRLYVNSDLGINSESDLQQVEDYLVSSGVIERPYMQQPRDFRFTQRGISIVEASLDQPADSVGPFPPVNVSIQGNVGPGSNLVIGSNNFTQSTQASQSENFAELIRLIEKVVVELPQDTKERGERIAEVLKEEALCAKPDRSFITKLAARLGTLASGVTTSVSSQMLLAYLKKEGMVP